MRHRVNGPSDRGLARRRLPAHRLGLRVEVALLEAEGIHAERVRVERVVARQRRQHPRHAQAQVARITAVEVEEVGVEQGRQIARVLNEDGVPHAAGLRPLPCNRRLCGREVRAFAVVGASSQRLGAGQPGTRLGHDRRLGKRQQKACMQHARQQPAGVGLGRGTQVGRGVTAEGDQTPQGPLGVLGRSGEVR